jgi:hypothetical protein
VNVYLPASNVPPAAASFLSALGNRLQTPGKEQFSLIGQYTDQSGTVSAQVVWQAPGNLTFTRSGNATPFTYSTTSGVANAAALAASDLDILESLLDDRPETFLYELAAGRINRLLGGRFRTDDGKTPNYSGPWYDVYQISAPVEATGGTVTRQKQFCFDSQTRLLALAIYTITKGGTTTVVSTEYSNWSIQNGQAVPGQILRRENGTVVFTFHVTGAAVSAAASAQTFTAQ